jgi:hypothetical protein
VQGRATAAYDCAKPRPLRWCEVDGNICCHLPANYFEPRRYVRSPEPPPEPSTTPADPVTIEPASAPTARAVPRRGMSKIAVMVALAQLGVLHTLPPRDAR